MSDLEHISSAIGSVAQFMQSKVKPESQPHKGGYRAYIESEDWRQRRSQFKRSVGEKNWLCWRCGIFEDGSYRLTRHGLEVHHKTYDRLGAELDSDLEVLCHFCHEKETYHAHTDDTKNWWRERGFNRHGQYVEESE